MSTWSPLPPVTNTPVPVESLHLGLNENPIVQTGLSILLLSIVAIIALIVLAAKHKILLSDLVNIRYVMMFYLVFIAFVGGSVLIGLEQNVSTVEDLRINRNTEGVLFSIFSIFFFFLLSIDLFNTFNSDLFYWLLAVSIVLAGIILSTIGISNFIQNYKYENNTAYLLSGVLVFVYGLYAIMFSKLTSLTDSKSMTMFWSGCVMSIIGFSLMVTASSLGLTTKKDGEYIAISTTPITPGDLTCTNISRTVTYGFGWSPNDIVRIIFRLNIGYLPPSTDGGPEPFLPTTLMTLRNGDNKIFEFRYQSKKLFLDYYDNKGVLLTTLSIDIKPTFNDTFYVSASIMGYDDVGDNKLGLISLYDEYGNAQTSQMYRDLFTSSKWGNNTTLNIKGNNVVDSVQICQKQISNSFFNIPVVYQISFVIVLVFLVYFIVTMFMLPKKIRNIFGIHSNSSIPDRYVQIFQ